MKTAAGSSRAALRVERDDIRRLAVQARRALLDLRTCGRGGAHVCAPASNYDCRHACGRSSHPLPGVTGGEVTAGRSSPWGEHIEPCSRLRARARVEGAAWGPHRIQEGSDEDGGLHGQVPRWVAREGP